MKIKGFESLLKKGLKRKVKITLSVLVMFLIKGNIGFGDLIPEGNENIINQKEYEIIDQADINISATKSVRGLHIRNSNNITVNIEKIDATLKNGNMGDEEGATGLFFAYTSSDITLGDNLEINVTVENDSSKYLYITGIDNRATGSTLGNNTKTNINVLGEVGKGSLIYGMRLSNQSITTGKTSTTILGSGSEINITSAKAGSLYGIYIEDLRNKVVPIKVILEDNIKVKAEILNANNSTDNQIVTINNIHGGEIEAGDGLEVEAKAATNGGVVNIWTISNNKEGNIIIGDEAKISADLNSEAQKNNVYSITNSGNSFLEVGNKAEISAKADNANVVTAISNNTSTFMLGNESNINILGEDTKYAYGLWNTAGGNIVLGNKAIIEAYGKNTDQTFGINNKGGNIKLGEKMRISLLHISDNTGSYARGINNEGGELSIEKGAVINVKGEKEGQIVGIVTSNSSNTTLENGSTIEVSGKNDTNFVAALYNTVGDTTLKGGTNINSNGYAVYNSGGNVLINDEGYTKKIQGDISSVAGTAVTDILLDTEDSYFEGGSFQSNDGIFNLGLKNDAVWYISSSSKVTDFDIENGIVDMTQNHKGEAVEEKQYVQLDNTTGSGGTYILDISPEDRDQSGDKTDGIYITKADKEQKNYIQAGKTSITGLANHDFSDKKNASIIIASADKNVTFEGSKFSDISNIYDYTLSLEENVNGETEAENIWYVTGIKKDEGEVVERIETDLTLNYMNAVLARLELDTIHKRLGEIRDYNSENGIWARIASGEMEHDKTSGKFKNDYNMLQVGYDKRKELEKGSVFTGFAVHKRDGKTDFRNGDGKNNNIGISLYKSYAYNDNSYTDLILKYSYLDNDYKSYTSTNQKMEADYNTWSGSLSIEHGKKYKKNDWYVTPHVQLNYTIVKGADYAMNSGVKVEQRDIKSFIGRAGIYAGHDLKNSSHFVKAGVLHEFAGEYGAKITGEDTSINKKYNGEDTWVEIGIGGQFKIGKTGTTHLYYDLEKTFGSDFETNWQASMGVRMEL